MRNSPRRSSPATAPHADPALRDSVARVTATDPRTFGFVLARLRAARRQTLAEQAVALGTTESAVTFLSVCRLPRPGRRDEDIAAVAAIVGIAVEVLRGLLGDPT